MPWNGKGHFVAFSADGIPWEDYADNPVTGFGNALTDGQYVLGWDERHARYVAYMRPSVYCFDPQGGLKVEVLDDSGQPRPGYGAAACPALATDFQDHVVGWSGRDLVQATAAEKDLGGEKLLFEY